MNLPITYYIRSIISIIMTKVGQMHRVAMPMSKEAIAKLCILYRVSVYTNIASPHQLPFFQISFKI